MVYVCENVTPVVILVDQNHVHIHVSLSESLSTLFSRPRKPEPKKSPTPEITGTPGQTSSAQDGSQATTSPATENQPTATEATANQAIASQASTSPPSSPAGSPPSNQATASLTTGNQGVPSQNGEMVSANSPGGQKSMAALVTQESGTPKPGPMQSGPPTTPSPRASPVQAGKPQLNNRTPTPSPTPQNKVSITPSDTGVKGSPASPVQTPQTVTPQKDHGDVTVTQTLTQTQDKLMTPIAASPGDSGVFVTESTPNGVTDHVSSPSPSTTAPLPLEVTTKDSTVRRVTATPESLTINCSFSPGKAITTKPPVIEKSETPSSEDPLESTSTNRSTPVSEPLYYEDPGEPSAPTSPTPTLQPGELPQTPATPPPFAVPPEEPAPPPPEVALDYRPPEVPTNNMITGVPTYVDFDCHFFVQEVAPG